MYLRFLPPENQKTQEHWTCLWQRLRPELTSCCPPCHRPRQGAAHLPPTWRLTVHLSKCPCFCFQG